MKLFYRLILVFIVLTALFLTGCSNNEKAMVDAVKNGDTAKVQSLLEKGVSPNLTADDGKSILMLAAYLGHTDIVKLLIENGADVNAKDKVGKTALMYTAETGYVDIAKLLLENGADLNAVTNDGRTALQIAKDNNQTAMVEFLSNWGKATPAPIIPTPAPKVEATPTPIVTPEPTPTEAPVQVVTPEPVISINKQLSSIFFDFDKSVLRSDQTQTLEDNLATLKDNPDMYIILSGHADERGTQVYNQLLSERRAKAIQQYLINNGIVAKRIIVYGFGKVHPFKNGHDEPSRSYNRRVDILEWDNVLSKEQVIDETIKQ